MYSRYSNMTSRNRYHHYPSYGHFDDSFVDYRSPRGWNEYYYGGGDYDFFWNRDDFSRYRSRIYKPLPPLPVAEAPKEEEAKVLKVEKVNLHPRTNAKRHRTNKFECVRNGQPVVRRGDTMKITVTFDREYDVDKSDAKIEFFTGKDAKESKGTRVVMKLIETKKVNFKPDKWDAAILSKNGKDLTIQVNIPVNCVVGTWNMIFNTYLEGKSDSTEDKSAVFKHIVKKDVIILFNPWCTDDTVSMTPPDNLDEYVLNDTGFVFVGYFRSPTARPWNFAQFNKGVLECALYLLNAACDCAPSRQQSDPIKVSRTMAKMVNSQDDCGLLVGNWSGNYEGGTSPTKWVGSNAIIQQFMKNKESVQYGQCWVFSALLTTMCRALGIPCRSVTNFASAHDTDCSMTIDSFYDCDDEPIDFMNSDSVWNFHVWCEVWLSRWDLDVKGMDGWNVIDATPQELSEGVFTCGPCPVAAVKRGLCSLPYDTTFVYAEVNADRVYWTRLPNGDLKRKEVKPHSVGKCIYTKNPKYDPKNLKSKKGSNITHEYKYEEGTVEERQTALTAHKVARVQRDVYTTKIEDADVEFHLNHKDTAMIGDELEICFSAKHIGKSKRAVKGVKITVSPKLYTDTVGKAFVTKKFEDFELKPKEQKKLTVTMKSTDYMEHLAEGAYVYIVANAIVPAEYERGRVVRPRQTVFKGHDFKFLKPDLLIENKGQLGSVGKSMEFTISFKNPIDKPLTNCEITLESNGFEDQKDIQQGDVPANGTFKTTVKATPIAKGFPYRSLMCSFECKELLDITGECFVEVPDDTEDLDD